MRKEDNLLEKVQNKIKRDTVDNLSIYFNYESPDEVAYIEIINDTNCKTMDCFMGEQIDFKIVRNMYPQFFKTQNNG